MGGCGTQTSGLGFGGYTTVVLADTEEYNGSAWTAGGNLNTARKGLGGAGTQTLSVGFGGETTVFTVDTEEYNGTSWTNRTSMTTARRTFASGGTQTAAFGAGGYGATGNSVATEEYTGTFLAAKKVTLT